MLRVALASAACCRCLASIIALLRVCACCTFLRVRVWRTLRPGAGPRGRTTPTPSLTHPSHPVTQPSHPVTQPWACAAILRRSALPPHGSPPHGSLTPRFPHPTVPSPHGSPHHGSLTPRFPTPRFPTTAMFDAPSGHRPTADKLQPRRPFPFLLHQPILQPHSPPPSPHPSSPHSFLHPRTPSSPPLPPHPPRRPILRVLCQVWAGIGRDHHGRPQQQPVPRLWLRHV
eukprot:363248-Chlamydomonas_euryale.AAC.14